MKNTIKGGVVALGISGAMAADASIQFVVDVQDDMCPWTIPPREGGGPASPGQSV